MDPPWSAATPARTTAPPAPARGRRRLRRPPDRIRPPGRTMVGTYHPPLRDHLSTPDSGPAPSHRNCEGEGAIQNRYGAPRSILRSLDHRDVAVDGLDRHLVAAAVDRCRLPDVLARASLAVVPLRAHARRSRAGCRDHVLLAAVLREGYLAVDVHSPAL